ncbi:hypothetical protein EXIGLDRAFT_312001 [Exidia glandulosa HHB12029]|uniref:Uncharacterized protein n=1 Tax=Exidia glandulosa HHB12029 TaxID=1314781 RepID=A0A165CZ51_EXIGL|nr:hypothetical protein EXIGLDRAFT_312001 [Exidia glandulosa HHB12029]
MPDVGTNEDGARVARRTAAKEFQNRVVDRRGDDDILRDMKAAPRPNKNVKVTLKTLKRIIKQVMKFLDEYEAKGHGKRHKVCLWIRRFWSNDDHQEELDELKRRFAAALDKLSFVSGVEISHHVRALQHNFSLRMEKADRMLHKIMKSVTDLPNNGLNKKAASQFMNGLLQNLVDELDTKQKSQRTYQHRFLTGLEAQLQQWRDADETKLSQKQEEWLQRLIDDMNERRRAAEQSRLEAQERLLQEITTGHDGSTQALQDAHQRLMDHINDRRMEDDERLDHVRNDIAQVITAANQALASVQCVRL